LTAKLAAVCIGSVGGAAACVATGLVPAPLGLADPGQPAHLERQVSSPGEASSEAQPTGVDYEPEPAPVQSESDASEDREPEHAKQKAEPTPAPASSSGAVEYTPPPAEPPPAPESAPTATAGDPSGEFGP
jgi:hypothetical protein